MSTQVPFDSCIDWRTPRPDLIPDFLGSFTSVEADRPLDWCKWADKPRRYEGRTLSGPTPRYGSGTPTLNSANVCKISGTGNGPPIAHEKVSTPQGFLNLPRQVQEVVRDHYMPETKTLDLLTHTADTRLQAEPSRYYR